MNLEILIDIDEDMLEGIDYLNEKFEVKILMNKKATLKGLRTPKKCCQSKIFHKSIFNVLILYICIYKMNHYLKAFWKYHSFV